MHKYLITSLLAFVVVVPGCVGLAPNPDPCPGQVTCPNQEACCPTGDTCSTDSTQCISSVVTGVVNNAEACLEQGLLPCPNALTLSIGCIPVGGVCCPSDGRYCQSNQTCGGNCGFECCDL